MPHFLGIYEAWPGFFERHSWAAHPIQWTAPVANVLGKPASYGCIILDLPTARWLYDWAENGVIVEIKE